ncbi:hypothetical protein E2562_021150 [Oryza meyeriana var. granulata]|uniref:Uncharacterized protein n=1 Tax=Oryza meyeriana var. granulata TaxID=110450 RepID=A0A6G1BMA5_9ORYZ|nr:hypothetical protein E2562_021150 [Oryza meyeriana var. granulata]
MAMAVIRLAPPSIPAAFSSSGCSVKTRRRVVRMRVRCCAGGSEGGEREGEGEEALESLFTKELRRRGMAPGRGLGLAARQRGEKEAGAEEGRRGGGEGTRVGGGKARGGGTRAGHGRGGGQWERSMALNSEGPGLG